MTSIFFTFAEKMVIFPHCKINLGLHVIEKRDDGFHNIETVFYPLPLTDILEIVPFPEGVTEFTQSGMHIPSDGKKNLCERAYELIKEDYNLPAVRIHLHKQIPSGAGLGGGSSDAAFTLSVLNEIFNLKIPINTLLEYTKKLGSDCSFFLFSHPCYATGRGELLSPLEIDLKGYYIILVIPILQVSTKLAYSGISPRPPQINIMEVLRRPIHFWKNNLLNDFEQTIFEKYPGIRKIKETLYSNGALYASMSGSGSAVFGLFSSKPDINNKALFNDCFVWESIL